MSRPSLPRKMLAAAALTGVGAAFWASPAAAAVDWQFIGRQHGDIIHYIDADSINRGGSVAAFWTMTVEGEWGKGGDVVERLGTAHCTDHAYKVIEERRNPETRLRQPTFAVLFRKSWRSFEAAERVPEGSPLRAIIDIACGNAEIAPIAFPAPAPTDAPAPAEPAAEVQPSAEGGSGAEPGTQASTEPGADTGSGPGRPAGPAAWVDLGASVTGQAILIDAASIRDDASPTAWFRLVNPDDEDPLPVSYLLRVDCKRRTITQLGLRKYDERGAVAEERDYGSEGEGPIEVEPETVMEVAWRNLCTGGAVDTVRGLAGLAPAGEAAAEGEQPD